MTRHGDYRTVTLADSLASIRARREAREDAPTTPGYDDDDDLSMLPGDRWDEDQLDDHEEYWAPPAHPAPTAPPVRRPRLSRKQIMVGIAANLTLIVAVVVAIGPAHLFVQAAVPNYTIYGDYLASGWHNWSHQSTVNLANTSPVYAGSRSIAWTPNSAWATLYLRAGTPISLGNYSALTFAMRASQANQHVGVELTDRSSHRIGPLVPLSNHGGTPPVSTWKVYAVPLSVLAPGANQAYGIALQNWSNHPAPTMYVDSIELLSRTSAAPAAATAAPTPTADPTATSTSTPMPMPTNSVLAGAPDTSSGIHVGQVAMTSMTSGQALLDAHPPVLEVWNWNGGGSVTSYPSIYAGEYFPVDRQPDTRYYAGAQPLSWFLTNHPDWIEYQCDRTTVAYYSGQPTLIPLDTGNLAVLSWLEATFYARAASGGYGHLDFDNFQLENNGGWTGQRCGHWTGTPGSSTWVQQYNATSNDPTYRANEIALAQNLQTWLHTNYPGVAFSANFAYDNNFPNDSDRVLAHIDLLLDENGFTNGNSGPPYNYTGAAWVAKAQHLWAFISAGHGWQDVNQFGSAFSTLTQAQKQWALANYLLLKNNASWVYICGYQEFGTLLMTPEYGAPTGSPTDAYYASQGVYMRDFTNGLALVNPSASTSYTVTLTGAHHDLYGHAVGSQVTLPPASGLVLLKG